MDMATWFQNSGDHFSDRSDNSITCLIRVPRFAKTCLDNFCFNLFIPTWNMQLQNRNNKNARRKKTFHCVIT